MSTRLESLFVIVIVFITPNRNFFFFFFLQSNKKTKSINIFVVSTVVLYMHKVVIRVDVSVVKKEN